VSTGNQVLYLAEPPAQYLMRPPVVIDCSVFAALVFREIGEAEALARMTGKALNAPHLLAVEMASVAQKKLKLSQVSQGPSELARQGLLQFEEADILYHEVSAIGVLELAARYQLTAYDASYLWLAAELKCPLLTFDVNLGKAATTHLALLP
jgi:predicted nucleic acid-binding protein